jgi:hypothetical protein
MIDNFSILLSHGWLMLAFWLLLARADLNDEPPPAPDAEPQGFVKRAKSPHASPMKPAANPYRKRRTGKNNDEQDDADA